MRPRRRKGSARKQWFERGRRPERLATESGGKRGREVVREVGTGEKGVVLGEKKKFEGNLLVLVLGGRMGGERRKSRGGLETN